MDKEILIKRYSEALEDGRAAIFAGAGLSASVGFVDWKGLLKNIAEELKVSIRDYTNLVDLAQYYVNESRNTTELGQAIVNSFPTSTNPTINHEILASLPIRTYWTTNFDKLIERSLEKAGKVCDVKSSPTSLAISKVQRDAIVYKMHGDVDNPDKTILTRDQFEGYEYTHKAFLESFGYDLTNKTFLFLGLSFDDPNLRYVLKHVRMLYKNNQRRHFYILRKARQNQNESEDDYNYRRRQQELFIEDIKNYGIETVLIDDYREITEILESVKKRYLRRTVFISGAAAEYGQYGEMPIKAFIRKLSASIIHEGFRIVNGYGLGFGNEVLAGALSQLKADHKPIDGNLFMRPFPQDIPDPKSYWPQYRREIISMTGISIFLLGNKIDKDTNRLNNSSGVEAEYNISKEHGNILVPVGATGFMAKVLCDRQIQDTNDDKCSPTKDELIALNNDGLDLEKLHNLIMDIIIKLK